MKPTVRRARTEAGHLADGWILTRPPYGFGTTQIRRYPTWRAAHRALERSIAAAGPVVERSHSGYAPGLTALWGRAHRPRWIET